MDIENISSLVLKTDVCRCCLSGSGTWDLTAAYITDAGMKEVFANLLKRCFGLSLSYINEMEASRLVCDLCVNQLRDASSFHDQVVRADKWFSDYWSINKVRDKKVTEQIDNTNSKECIRDIIYDDIADSNTSPQSRSGNKETGNEELLKTSDEINKKERKRNLRRDNDSNAYDSDTPIARLKNSEIDEDCSNKKLEANENCLTVNEDKVRINITDQPGVKNNTKQVSERRRVILTCSVVLVETTACPFRHHKSWFRCFFCTEDFMDIDLLRLHYTQLHLDVEAEIKKIKRYPRSLQIEISNLECRHCHTILTDVGQMATHFVEKHNKVIYKECIADYKVNCSPYACHLCKKEFHVFRTLTTHLNEHYANCICDVCGKSFINSKRLRVHKRTHENGAYPCSTCGKVLKTKTSQSNHMESAHSKRVIKCQICFKPMKHYNDRIKHMSETHNITHKFKCPFCDRVYNIKHYLATHIRQTHGHKNKKCKVCGMAFITNHSLKKHMSKHTGERPFSCTVCSKSYARSYTLREHMRVHENEKRIISSQ